MYRKLIYLISFVLMLSIAGNASAELVAYWTFDEGSGDIAYDSSGNGNNGTIHGAEWDAGKYGQALLFNGQDNYVEVPTSDSLEIAANVTIAAWINWIDAGDTWLAIMANGQQNGPWENYGLFVNRGGRYLYFTLSLDGGHVTQSAPNNVIEPDQWLHACATWDGSTARIYVNGEMVLEQAQAGQLVPPQLPLRIGHRNGSAHYYNGIIDEVRIYNHALTESEILAAMEGGKGYPYALGPLPKDGALHSDTWVSLSWRAGDFALSHDVYFGENLDDVNDAAEGTFQGNQTSTFFVVGFPGFAYPDGLVPGTTYYWRIDEVNDTEPNSPWKGSVWNFTVPPKTAYNPDPAEGAESVDPNVELSWTGGFGAKLHTVYFGDNFDDVNNAAGGLPQGNTTYTPGPLKLAKTYYWRVDEFDAIETYKGHVWSFTTQGAVGNPDPPNGAVDIKQTQIITFSPGVYAASHQVYFGANE
ncbi:MAG: LamG-like jellyroll fold domain-containing protein, partial [Planctomycetota bacterium]